MKKRGLAHEHSLEYLGTFKFFELVIVLPFIPLLNLNYSFRTYAWLYVLSIFITAGLYYQAKGFKHVQFSKALPLFELRTVITLFASMILLGEFLSWVQVFGVAIILLSLYHIQSVGSVRGTIREFFHSKGLHAMLVSMFLLGVTIVFEKKLLLDTNIFSYLSIMYAFSLINALAALTIVYDGYSRVINGVRKEGTLIFEAALFSTLSNIFFLAALTTAYVALAEALRKTSSILAMVLGRRYFHDKHYKKRLFWTVVAVMGVVLLV